MVLESGQSNQMQPMLRSREAIWQELAGVFADYVCEVYLLPDGTATLHTCTPGFTHLTGYTLEHLNRNGGWYNLIHPQDRTIVQQHCANLATVGASHFQVRIITRNGAVLWMQHYAHLLPPADKPTRLAILIAARDSTVAQPVPPDVAHMQRLHAVARHNSDGMLLIDAQGTIIHTILDQPDFGQPAGMPLTNRHITEILHPDDYNLLLSHLTALLANPQHRMREILRFLSTAQPYRWVEATASNCLDDTLINAIVISYRDVSAQKRQEDLIWRLAYTDDLTGLANRRQMYHIGNQLLSEYADGGRFLALLYLDLDRFKVVNDSLGHDAGDNLLVQVAERLAGCIDEPSLLGRIGGDEFAVLVPDANIAYALEVARLMLSRISQPFTLRGQQIYLDGSVGIALSNGDIRDFSALLTHADIAMYGAKHSGKGVHVFEPDANSSRHNRLLLEAELREALINNELTLYYQPITNIAASQIVALEALIRWPHPTLGLLTPSAFMPLIEEIGLMGILDRWVLKRAIQQLAEWHTQGYRVAVSINLTAYSLRDPELIFDLEDLLAEYDVAPEYVILEVTEHVALHDLTISRQVLGMLRQLGIRIALDDFGTGYASLTYLRQLPVAILKLDRSFAVGVGEDPADEAVMSALINLGNGLQLTVIAEGIEYPRQHEWLRATGNHLLQGYLLGAPASVEQITQRLAGQQGSQ